MPVPARFLRQCLRFCGPAFRLLACATLGGCAASVNDYLIEARRGDPESILEAVVNAGRLLRDKEDQGIPYDAGDDEAIKYLAEVAEKGKDAVNRSSAVVSLSHLRRPQLTKLYLTCIADKSWSVQLEAAKALGRRVDTAAVAALVERLKGDVRIEVRLEILRTLAKTGGEAALKTLLAAFLDTAGPNADARLTIFDGLRELGQTQLAFDDLSGWRQLAQSKFPDLDAASGGRSAATTGHQEP